MAITENDINWLEPGFIKPQRTADEDAKRWTVWADRRGTEWAERNGVPFAALGEFQGTDAHFLIDRLYGIYGNGTRLGIKQEWIA
jgi:hypothetical protein